MSRKNRHQNNVKWRRYDRAVAEALEEVERAGEPSQLLPTFQKYQRKLSHLAYWHLLGAIWNRYLLNDVEAWEQCLSANRPYRQHCLMNTREAEAYRALSPYVSLFRPHRTEKPPFVFSPDPSACTEHGGIWAQVHRRDVIALFNRHRGAEALLEFDSTPIAESYVSARDAVSFLAPSSPMSLLS